MNECDKTEFKQLMEEICAEYDREFKPLLDPYWRKLSPIMDIETLRGAIDAHSMDSDRGRFFPKVADIMHQIEKVSQGDDRPDADEAWAICLQSYDENVTVSITEEIMRARAIAMPVYNAGDKVGGRMAFKAAYTRIADEGRRTRQLPGWFVSDGFDSSRRDEVRLAAIASGHRPMLGTDPRRLVNGVDYGDDDVYLDYTFRYKRGELAGQIHKRMLASDGETDAKVALPSQERRDGIPKNQERSV